MGVDIIDYTYLQKRGLVKKSEPVSPLGASVTKDGFIELENNSNNIGNDFTSNVDVNLPVPEQTQNSEGGLFGFMDNPSPSGSFFANAESPKPAEQNLEVNGLKLKIDDLEYKLGNLIEQFTKIETKLLEFERKVSK